MKETVLCQDASSSNNVETLRISLKDDLQLLPYRPMSDLYPDGSPFIVITEPLHRTAL